MLRNEESLWSDFSFRAQWLLSMYRVFIKYCVFSQELLKVCHPSLVSTRLLLVVQKITSQLELLYTRIAMRALKVSYSDVSEGSFAVNCEKKFPEHPAFEGIN